MVKVRGDALYAVYVDTDGTEWWHNAYEYNLRAIKDGTGFDRDAKFLMVLDPVERDDDE